MYLSKVRLNASLALSAALAAHAHAGGDAFDFDLNAQQERPAALQAAGFFESRNHYFTGPDNWESTRLTGHLELKWGQYSQANGGRLRGFASAEIQHDEQTRGYRDPTRTELLELYMVWDSEHTDLTVGKQRVAWGTADGVSTIDRVNAVDLREPIANARTASRRPSWMVRLESKLAAGTLDAVWLPRGRDAKLPEFGSPWEPALLHLLRRQRAQGLISLDIEDPHAHEFGLRYLVYSRGFDWSVGWFNGYTDGPVEFSQQQTAARLSPVRVQTYNFSAAVGLQHSTLRGEVAYTPDTWVAGRKSDLMQAVIGWDRTFLTNLYTNLQLFWDEAGDSKDTYGLTFAVTNTLFNDAATVGVRGQAANDNQLAAELFIEYSFGDHLSLDAKFLAFEADADTPLYDYRNNDLIEISLRWEY